MQDLMLCGGSDAPIIPIGTNLRAITPIFIGWLILFT
jgi:hypothetical protein